MDTLNGAISKEKDVDGLIIHSDQSFQYTSNEYKSMRKLNGITISIAQKSAPFDDSPMENWLSLLEKKLCTQQYYIFTRIYSTFRRMDIILSADCLK